MLLSVFVVSAQGANLLTNGKFTDGLTSWDVNLVVVGSPPADVNAAVQTAVNYDGTPCLFMRSRTGVWQGAEVHQVVNVTGLTTVDFSCVANKWAWGDVRVDLNWYTGPYDPCYPDVNWLSWEQWDIVVDGAATTDWDSFAHTFTVPSTAKYVVFRLRVNDWVWQVYFDDVFFGTPVLDQATLVAPPAGSQISKEEKVNCGYGPTLQWNAATDADGNHLVYFGTSFADVNDANTSDPEYKVSLPLGTTLYTLPLAGVTKGQAYFWRVDETVGGNVVKGLSVWQFSVSNITWVDGFDNYHPDIGYDVGEELLQAVWGPNATGAADFNLQIVYEGALYNAVGADTSALLCSSNISENAMLVLLVRGHDNMKEPNNIYVKLESDSGAQSGIVHFPEPNALNQQLYEPMILWPIDLQEFASQGVDLTNVTQIIIGVDNGSGGSPGDSGTVTINDIRLDYPWCDSAMAELIPADFTKDCYVGMDDMDLLANNWLAASTEVTAVEPSAANLILRYQFNEGTGSAPADSSGHGYTGTMSSASAWGGAGTGVGGTNCLRLNNIDRVAVPVAVNNDHKTIGAESTISFWLKDPGQTDADSMILQVGHDGNCINIWSGSTGSFSYRAGWDTALGYGDGLDIAAQNVTNPDHPQDKWVHYAFVKSVSGHYQKVYRNGRLIALNDNATTAETPGLNGTTDFFTIGAWRWSGGYGGYYDGLMDDFRVYDSALSAEEVLYLAVQGGTAASPMTQGLLTTTDATGNNKVDFYDFAVMAQYWLQDVVWP